MTATDAADWSIRSVGGPEELIACVRLQEETWGEGFSERVPPTMLQLVQRLGGVLEGAFDASGALVGFVFGLPGLRAGELIHWSDMLAVRPDWRGRGIGLALKRRQRELLRARGCALACWTFEPLEARNAHLNLARLGARATEYIRDFYGVGDSPLHAGIGTDRLIALWELGSERVAQRLDRARRPPSSGGLERLPAVLAPEKSFAPPRPGSPRLEHEEPAVRIAVPARIQELKRSDEAIARDWRRATRAAFEAYFARGYAAQDFIRGQDVGWYVLARVRERGQPVPFRRGSP